MKRLHAMGERLRGVPWDWGRALRGLDVGLVALATMLLAASFVGLWLAPGSDAREFTPSGPGVRPVTLMVPSIDLDARVVPIEVQANGALDPPKDTDLVGWWKRSAKAGAGRGQTVMTGHNVSHGKGVMDDLSKVKTGAKVQVRTASTTVTYRVVRKVELNHTQLAQRAQRLFGQQRRDNRLVLVTCSDYRNGVWNKNYFVFATPTGVSER